jgi:hypothetical protein
VNFYQRNAQSAPKKANSQEPIANSQFTNPKASTNMTMIAKVDNGQWTMDNRPNGAIRVYVGDELAGVATPIDSLYFLTIQSDATGGTLRFETEDGTVLTPINSAERLPDGTGRAASAERGTVVTINYVPDAHYGTLQAPVILISAEADDNRTYKIIEDDHVVIIRNGERYDVTGNKLLTHLSEWRDR